MNHKMVLLAVLVAAAGLLAGCEEKFTQKRFDTMIINGQSKMEVEKILGEPEARWDTAWMYVNYDEGYSGKVVFDKDGKVIGKKWSDSVRQDKDPETEWREGDWPESKEGQPGAQPGASGGGSSQEMMVTP